MALDYSSRFALQAHEYEAAVDILSRELPTLWLDEYYAMCRHSPNVLQFAVEGFEHLFDFTSDPTAGEAASVAEDRLVAVFGRSRPQAEPRDASRMRGFLGGGLRGVEGAPLDKGHFIGHSLGGGTDVNLFPQRPELNRGWSDPGRVFRRMERYASTHAGTFVFARPLYRDASWQPAELEYGLLMPERILWVERFGN